MLYFHNEDVTFIPRAKKKVKQVVAQLVENEGFVLECVHVILCSDEYLLRMNREYLEHDYYTDIITFDNSEKPSHIEGDLFISIDRARENSKQFGVSIQDEFRRLVMHGCLHLCGFGDASDSQKQLMRSKEDEYLAYF